MQRVVEHLGSYRKLYADKIASERTHAPWDALSTSERNVVIKQMVDEAGDSDIALLFLVDGSGSVTQGCDGGFHRDVDCGDDGCDHTLYITKTLPPQRISLPP